MDTQLHKQTYRNSIKVSIVVKSTNKYVHYYKILGTSVLAGPIPKPSLILAIEHQIIGSLNAWGTFRHSTYWTNQSVFMKIPKVVKPTNKKTWL